MTCKHETIRTWLFADTAEPSGLWSCVYCGRKFEPLDVDRDAELIALRAAITEALRMMGNWPEGAEAALQDALAARKVD